MNYFVFRNNTIERFFPKEYSFSGYEDISVIPSEVDGYIWFYQEPFSSSIEIACGKIMDYRKGFDYILKKISLVKPIIALTIEELFMAPLEDGDYRLKEAISSYNSFLIESADIHSNVKVIDLSGFTRNYSSRELLDWKFFFISQMGLNPKLTTDFRNWWDQKMRSLSLSRKKCIVLDLDNTLWGGVLGEDGINGIRIGGDYPGKAFLFFQNSLLQLSHEGVILTVCSKNNEQDVLEAWHKNPFNVLRKDSFATWRINWLDKATNVKSIAEELNIGLDSIVFVDDNPTERELIRQMLPMVYVPDFPLQPYDLPQFFRELVDDCFKVYSITQEDKNKTDQYKSNAARVKASKGFDDYEAFIESLNIQLTVSEANEFNISRIAQMTQKTNQFNLTTKRYTETDINRFLSQGWKIWCLKVTDRFGDSGITGAILVNENRIDSFLLSCRILGKGIEYAFINSILQLLKDDGLTKVFASYIPTLKNGQVIDFYERVGFEQINVSEDGIKEYEIDLSEVDLIVKGYYKVSIV